MKQLSEGMMALLEGYQFCVAELYTLTLADGTVHRWTSGDGDIAIPTVVQSGDTLLKLVGTQDDVSYLNHTFVAVDTPPVGLVFNGTGNIVATQVGGNQSSTGAQKFDFIVNRSATQNSADEIIMYMQGVCYIYMMSDRMIIGTWSESPTACFFDFVTEQSYAVSIIIRSNAVDFYVDNALIQHFDYGYSGFIYAPGNGLAIGGSGYGTSRLYATLEYFEWTINIADISSFINYVPQALERNDITLSTGVSVDECAVTLYCNEDAAINGLSFPHFARIGGFDNAHLKIELAVMPAFGDVSNGLIHLFEGNVTDVKMDVSKVELTVSSDSIRFDTQIPTAIYQPTCSHTLYDSHCGVNRAGFIESGTVLSNTGNAINFTSGNGVGFFELGKITFSTGANAGLSRTVKTHTLSAGVATIVTADNFPFTPAICDAFVIAAGCNKLRPTCAAKFSNGSQFLGWEYMPVPEASL